MVQRLLISTLAVLACWNADPRPAHAWVILRVLPKGEIPAQCPQSIARILKQVPPIRGEAIDGFPSYQCSLYYRGTQENVQDLLDGLSQAQEISLSVQIDRSGNVGKLASRKAFPLSRPLSYLYRVNFQRQDTIDLGFEQTKPRISISVTVFSAGGIDPDQLKLPGVAEGVKIFTGESAVLR
jgi:hypothetical protein